MAIPPDGRDWWEFTHRDSVRYRCSMTVYHQGSRYYEGGRIISARLDGGRATAKTSGSQRYNVTVLLNKEASCDCSYGQYGGPCHHVVAAMLYIHDNLEELLEMAQRRTRAVDRFLDTLPAERILGFLESKLKHDDDMYLEFIEHLGLKDPSTRPDPVGRLRRMYEEALAAGHIRYKLNLDEIFHIAIECREAGEHGEATKTYMALVSTISNNMDKTDDPDGFYADCVIEGIEHMAESAVRENPDIHERTRYVSYMLEGCVGAGDGMAVHYSNALEIMCNTPQDLELLEGMVGEYMRREDTPGYGMAALARVKVHILEETGRHQESAAFLSGAYHIDEGLGLRYLETLHGGDHTHARREARNVVVAFPKSVEVARSALRVYRKEDAEHTDTARWLFLETGEWTYLDMLKETVPDAWSEIRRLGGTMAHKRPERAVEMYIREGMHEDAMDAVEGAHSLDVYDAFRPRLARKDHRRYFEAYGREIQEFAASRTGRDHYTRVREHLLNIRKIPRCEDAYGELLGKMRRVHSGRRVFLDIIADLQA